MNQKKKPFLIFFFPAQSEQYPFKEDPSFIQYWNSIKPLNNKEFNPYDESYKIEPRKVKNKKTKIKKK